MSKYRHNLPQLQGGTFMTDGGMETTLIFHEGRDLPHFASFVLLESEQGRNALRRYYQRYLNVAQANGVGFILDSATWRANPDWGTLLGYDAEGLRAANHNAIALLDELRRAWDSRSTPCVISGAIGPRGDAYQAGRMSADEAEAYHNVQIAAFAETAADMVTAFTLNQIDEAIGIVRAARTHAMPCAISFTVETDGKLISGQTLQHAIAMVDAATNGYPAYYMINCAHPTHFEPALTTGEPWVNRLRGIRANASAKSHAELDESTELDSGDPLDLGQRYRALRKRFPGLQILGGCCGTDHRHIGAICAGCLPAAA